MKILVLGDSLTIARNTKGCFYLADAFPQLDLTLVGKKGWGSQDVLTLLPTLAFENYDGVFLWIGINDAQFKSEVVPYYFRRNLQAIIQQIPKPLLIISPPCVDEKKQWERSNQRIGEYVTILASFQQPFFNFYDALLKRSDYPQLLKGAFDDGLHFEEAGYAFLAKELYRQKKAFFNGLMPPKSS